MSPTPAEELVPRLVLGPALRSQPDRRLVRLVREGYETAFEEIVRRYGGPLRRYAAAIVGGHAEDVTQDAFSKALLALRRDGTEVELRPWLYRIVRNTALNDLRDRPPAPQALGEAMVGGGNVSEEVERRQEVAELMRRLRALPEPQRAAIVMRELEGLSHEEIAAALGTTGGGARQAIHRARTALRDAIGAAIPLPLLRLLIDHGAEATAAAGVGGAAGAAAGASIGGAGGGGALKAGLATALIAGSVGTGVALDADQQERGGGASAAAASAARTGASSRDGGRGPASAAAADTATGASGGESHSRGSGGDDRGGGSGSGERSGPGGGSERDSSGPSDRSGAGPGGEDRDEAVEIDDRSGPGDGESLSSGSGPNSGPGPGGVELSSGEPSDSSGSSGPSDSSGSSGSSSDSSGSGSDSSGTGYSSGTSSGSGSGSGSAGEEFADE